MEETAAQTFDQILGTFNRRLRTLRERSRHPSFRGVYILVHRVVCRVVCHSRCAGVGVDRSGVVVAGECQVSLNAGMKFARDPDWIGAGLAVVTVVAVVAGLVCALLE